MEKANFHIVQMAGSLPRSERYINLNGDITGEAAFGIYCFNNIADAGYIDVDEFIYFILTV